jgi:hypothetical protein
LAWFDEWGEERVWPRSIVVPSSKTRQLISFYFFWMGPMFRRLSEWLDLVNRVREHYRKAFGRYPSLFRPKSFGEKMQWRKLFDKNDLFTVFSDKFLVRSYVEERGFGAHLIPVLWVGDDLEQLAFSALNPPFVVKATHGWQQTIFVRNSQFDVDTIKAEANGWLGRCHGVTRLEPGYLRVPHRFIVERLLTCSDGRPPAEYKLFVFDGVAQVINCIITEPDRSSRSSFHRSNWERLAWQGLRTPLPGDPPKPTNLQTMIDLAEGLGRDLDHVRVDLYDCDGKIYVGELTVYSWSGWNNLKPQAADVELGSFWKIRSPTSRAWKAIAFSSWGS